MFELIRQFIGSKMCIVGITLAASDEVKMESQPCRITNTSSVALDEPAVEIRCNVSSFYIYRIDAIQSLSLVPCQEKPSDR